jgi:putative flippase GtrA
MSVRVKEPALRASEVTVPRLAAPFARRWPALWLRLHRFTRFGLVGLSGIFVNEGAVAAFIASGMPGLAAVFAATQVSSAWNFALIERWAFRDKEMGRRLWHRGFMFFAVNNLSTLVFQAPLILLLQSMGVAVVYGNLITLLMLSVARFVLSDIVIWASPTRAAEEEQDPIDELETSRVLYVAGDVDVADLSEQTTGGSRRVVDLTEEVTARHAEHGLRTGGGRRRFPVPDVTVP